MLALGQLLNTEVHFKDIAPRACKPPIVASIFLSCQFFPDPIIHHYPLLLASCLRLVHRVVEQALTVLEHVFASEFRAL